MNVLIWLSTLPFDEYNWSFLLMYSVHYDLSPFVNTQ